MPIFDVITWVLGIAGFLVTAALFAGYWLEAS